MTGTNDRIKLVILSLALLLPALCASALSRIQLEQGGEITAKILDDRADRIVVDLGFTILTIPSEAVSSITDANDPDAENSATNSTLYNTDNGAPILSARELAQKVGEAVVTVSTPEGLGSGFIIHPDGYVITNDHVIAGENKIAITLFEHENGGVLVKTVFDNVRIVASSAELDLALLKIENTGGRTFQTVPVGDNDLLGQGQRVFAIGNPLGLERSVSEGLVSIPNRLIQGRIYIQTTAQINPGNSGGPLFNMRGEVVGVINMKIAWIGTEGLAFAIPSETLKNFIKHRDTFAFDPRNPNSGFHYNTPPSLSKSTEENK